MCELCIVHPETYEEVLPGWRLIKATDKGNIMKAGQWGLVHSNDPSFVWDDEPVVDVLEDWSEEAIEAMPKGEFFRISKIFNEPAVRFEKKLTGSPRVGYLLYGAAIKAGYIPEEYGRFAWWLFDHLGRHIRDHKPTLDC